MALAPRALPQNDEALRQLNQTAAAATPGAATALANQSAAANTPGAALSLPSLPPADASAVLPGAVTPAAGAGVPAGAVGADTLPAGFQQTEGSLFQQVPGSLFQQQPGSLVGGDPAGSSVTVFNPAAFFGDAPAMATNPRPVRLFRGGEVSTVDFNRNDGLRGVPVSTAQTLQAQASAAQNAAAIQQAQIAANASLVGTEVQAATEAARIRESARQFEASPQLIGARTQYGPGGIPLGQETRYAIPDQTRQMAAVPAARSGTARRPSFASAEAFISAARADPQYNSVPDAELRKFYRDNYETK